MVKIVPKILYIGIFKRKLRELFPFVIFKFLPVVGTESRVKGSVGYY